MKTLKILSETTRPRALIFDIKNHLVVLYQFCSNYAPGAKNWPAPGVTMAYIKLFFSEYGHVAYQIKGNEAYNYMLANVLPIHTSLTPGGSKGHLFSSPEPKAHG